MGGDHIVQHGWQAPQVGVRRHNERGGCARDILAGNIDAHLAGGLGPAHPGAGEKFAVGQVHGKLLDPAVRHVVIGLCFRDGGYSGPMK